MHGKDDLASGGTRKNVLLVERMASLPGFETVADRVFGRPDLAPFVLVGTVYVLDIPVLDGFQYLTDPSHLIRYLRNPAILAARGPFSSW